MWGHDNQLRTTETSSRTMVVAIVGATATGKSQLAISLAQRLGAEIVNADAAQLYRGMDIGTAKVTAAERRQVPHHQLDVLTVREEASVAAYQRAARADIAAIQTRAAIPLVTGGSGLYVRALLDRFEIPPTDPQVRAGLEQRLAAEGAQRLHLELAEADPGAAARILSTNGRRIVRALEVIEITGRAFSATLPQREFHAPSVLIGLRAKPEVLDERITRRTDQMWADGMLAEVAGLVPHGLREGRTASRAIGYAQALDQLDGRLSEAAAIEQTALATRRLARRQRSWFAGDPRVRWLEHDEPALVDRALGVLRAAGVTAAD